MRKKKGVTMKIFPSIENKLGTFVRKNHAENVHQKLVPDPFLILLNTPKQPLDTRNFFKNKVF